MPAKTVAIIGSGIVGTTLAYLLTQKGYQVDIFEKGADYPYPHSAQFQEKSWYLYDNPAYKLPGDLQHLTLTGDYTFDLNQERVMGVGGSATQWSAITLRMHPADFKTKSRYGYGNDWPLTYAELEPYYGRAETLLGVAGMDSDNPFAPHRTQPYPLPAFALSYDDLLLAEQLRKADIVLHTTPQARTRQPFDGRAGCMNFGVCRFCPIGARYSPNHHLLQAVATGLCTVHTNSSVRRIVLNAAGAARALVYREHEAATDQEHGADIIILAAGAIESARLLLLSTASSYPDGIGNRSGQVGQQVTLHHIWGGRIHYPTLLYPSRIGAWTGQSHQFLDPPTRGRHGGIKLEFPSIAGYSPERAYAHKGSQWESGLEAAQTLEPMRQWRTVGLHAESVPSAQKYVALSTAQDRYGDAYAHVHYQSADFDYATYEFAQELFARVVAASGGDDAELLTVGQYQSGHHHMGGCRMGDHERDSVVDAVGKVHGIPNLFVLGGSNFVGTSGAVNPTLTMVALAMRTTDYLFDQLL